MTADDECDVAAYRSAGSAWKKGNKMKLVGH